MRSGRRPLSRWSKPSVVPLVCMGLLPELPVQRVRVAGAAGQVVGAMVHGGGLAWSSEVARR